MNIILHVIGGKYKKFKILVIIVVKFKLVNSMDDEQGLVKKLTKYN